MPHIMSNLSQSTKHMLKKSLVFPTYRPSQKKGSNKFECLMGEESKSRKR